MRDARNRDTTNIPRPLLLLFAAGASVLGGCNEHSTGPTTTLTCGSTEIVTLGVLQAATIDCSNGGTFTLAGGSASYLVVPQFVTDSASNQPVAYTIAVNGSTASTARMAGDYTQRMGTPPTLARNAWNPTSPIAGPGTLQQEFDAMRRASAQRYVTSTRWRAQPGSRTSVTPLLAASAVVQPPAVGSLQDFHVLTSTDAFPPTTKRVRARLSYAGPNVLIYIDTLAPPNGFTANQLNEFGQLFDQTLYALDLGVFGSPSDIDLNGRVIMLLSPAVNALTPSSQCGTQGYIAGFIDGFDLVSTDTSSNRGEIFYSIVPDPNGTVSCAHSVSAVLADVPGVFLHEVQHLINFSQHVLVHHGHPEAGWLDEGMSLLASELGALYYEQKFPPPTGRTNPNQLFPDSAEGFIVEQLASSYDYLLRPDTATLTLHSDADQGLTWRGGDWLLLRWLGDQKGNGFYKQLEQTSLTGTANIAAAAAEPFESLFGDFSLALYTDSIPGMPRSAIPSRNRFTTRALRQLYQAYYNAVGPSSSTPQPFPIAPMPLTGTVHAVMVPGTMTFYQINTASSAPEVQVQFSTSSGTALAAQLHSQVSVFRLPSP